jgi:hypothetical protein
MMIDHYLPLVNVCLYFCVTVNKQKKEIIMNKNLKNLQLFYASVMADAVYHFDNAGILNMVTEKKFQQQHLTAASQLKQLNIATPEELFSYFSEVFGCIQWDVHQNDGAVVAKGKHCLLCSLAKRMQTAQPCFLYCINPTRALLKAMQPGFDLKVEKTLWDSDDCIFSALKTIN